LLLNPAICLQRNWAVIIIRNRGDLPGFVEALDVKASEMAAVRLAPEQQKRLMLREHA
jgi:hypothetical protein